MDVYILVRRNLVFRELMYFQEERATNLSSVSSLPKLQLTFPDIGMI